MYASSFLSLFFWGGSLCVLILIFCSHRKNQVRSWLSKAVNRDIEKASRNDPKNDLYSESSGGMGSGINSLMAVYCLQILIQQIEAVSKQLHQGNVVCYTVDFSFLFFLLLLCFFVSFLLPLYSTSTFVRFVHKKICLYVFHFSLSSDYLSPSIFERLSIL